MINPMDLTGKHVIITGGSSGIGQQCAIQASHLGAKVTLIARNEERLRGTIQLMEYPENQSYYVADLNETDKISQLVETIIAQRGAVDGFCHAAGIGTIRMLKASKTRYVENMFRIHTFAFIELVRCLSLRTNLNDGASLVGISSVAGEKGDMAQGVYAAAKASMNSFIQPVAHELSTRRIRINTVAYAMVDTPLCQEFMEIGNSAEALKRQYLGIIDVQSAANAVMFLLSDACRFITGEVLPVYAGY